MGNDSSNIEDQRKVEAFKQRFRQIGPQEDSKYGKYDLYEDSHSSNSKTLVIQKVVDFSSKEEHREMATTLKRREGIKSPYLCELFGSFNCSEATMCSTLYFLGILYEYPTYDLEQDLKNRLRLPETSPDKVDSV